MTEHPFEITSWTRTPSLFELDRGSALREDRPELEHFQTYSLTRGVTSDWLRRQWGSVVRRFRKLEQKETLVDREPAWLPLLDVSVPEAVKASVTYKQGESAQSGAELKIFGTGFGGSLTASLKETRAFNADGIGKSYQMKVLVTATLFASADGDDQVVMMDAELPPGHPDYQIVNLPDCPFPGSLDSPQWEIVHRVNLTGANQGVYSWERENTTEASWRVDAGIAIPETLGIKLAWTLKVTGAQSISVKYDMPYGNEYVFYQPSNQVMLAPFCSVSPDLTVGG